MRKVVLIQAQSKPVTCNYCSNALRRDIKYCSRQRGKASEERGQGYGRICDIRLKSSSRSVMVLLRCAPLTGPRQKVKSPRAMKLESAPNRFCANKDWSDAVRPEARAPRSPTSKKVPTRMSIVGSTAAILGHTPTLEESNAP